MVVSKCAACEMMAAQVLNSTRRINCAACVPTEHPRVVFKTEDGQSRIKVKSSAPLDIDLDRATATQVNARVERLSARKRRRTMQMRRAATPLPSGFPPSSRATFRPDYSPSEPTPSRTSPSYSPHPTDDNNDVNTDAVSATDDEDTTVTQEYSEEELATTEEDEPTLAGVQESVNAVRLQLDTVVNALFRGGRRYKIIDTQAPVRIVAGGFTFLETHHFNARFLSESPGHLRYRVDHQFLPQFWLEFDIPMISQHTN